MNYTNTSFRNTAHFRKLFMHSAAFIWAAAVILSLIGWRVVVILHEPVISKSAVSELAAIGSFRQDLSPNSTDTRLVYCRDTEAGVGLYFCDTATGKSKLVADQKQSTWQRFSMLGWSPDDSLFAYAFPSNPERREEDIVICSGDFGEEVSRIPVDANLYELTWLTPRLFAYSTGSGRDLYVFEKTNTNSWIKKGEFKGIGRKKLECLIGLSDNLVAWKDDEDLCVLQIDSGFLQRVWKSSGATNTALDDFTYSRSDKEFLLNCSDSRGRFLKRFILGAGSGNSADRLGPERDSVRHAKWTKCGPRYVYLSSDRNGEPFLNIYAGSNTVPICTPSQTWIRNWSLGSNHVYFTGCTGGQLPGIWEFDINAKICRCVVPSLQGSRTSLLSVIPSTGIITNADGNPRVYYLWQPEHLESGKRYPVVVHGEFWDSIPYAQIAAREGVFFAVVDESCVAQLINTLAKSSTVDTNRLYLFGSSQGSAFVTSLINRNPDSWRKIILFSPITLPEVPILMGKKVMIVSGTDDNWVPVGSLTQYQDQAIAAGISVKLYFEKHGGHMFVSIAAERRRALQYAKFLSED